MRWVRRLIGVALVIAVMVGCWQFAAENQTEVAVSYLWGVVDLQVWQALALCFAAGFVLAGLGWSWFGVRASLVQRRYRKAVGGLESEIHELRNLPLAPDASGASAAESDADAGGRGG